jgi:endonuclease/exonuclease/phosphatase family metal-dependent hydrolase
VYTASVAECNEGGDDDVDEDFPLIAFPYELRLKTLNLHMQSPSQDFYDELLSTDVMCLQEVTGIALQDILASTEARSFQIESAIRHGLSCSAEGFDVAILYRAETFRLIQSKVTPLPCPSVRRLLQVKLHMIANGALVVAGTAHLTASRENASVRSAELDSCFKTLESEDADVLLLVGDLNMHDGEALSSECVNAWQDAFLVAGAPDDLSNTWNPFGGALTPPRVGQWRFDRILYSAKCLERSASHSCVTTDHACAEQRASSFHQSSFEFSDHKMMEVVLAIQPNCITTRRCFQAQRSDLVRPGLGKEVARRPARTESCAKEFGSGGLCYCGKDYEKSRMRPGSAVMLEDEVRRALYRLYTRRNGHVMNSHDPLELTGLVANADKQVILTIQVSCLYCRSYIGPYIFSRGH